MDASKQSQRKVVAWAVGIAGGTGPALMHEGFIFDARAVSIEPIYVAALIAGAIAGALVEDDRRLRLLGAATGVAASAGATFAVSHVAHMHSVSFTLVVLIGFVGAAPGLMIGGLFLGMARDWVSRR